MKTVLYLIQARAGLPEIYSCLRKRNFLILSYREETVDTCIFAPNTTWTQGRNILHKYVRKNNLKYDYYVFMDEDIVFLDPSYITDIYLFLLRRLQSLPYRGKNTFDQEGGFRSFEESLNLGYPIVTMYYLRGGGRLAPDRKVARKWPRLSRYLIHDNRPGARHTWAVQTVSNSDALFIGVSQEVFFANTVLPYEEKYDSYSYFHSNVIFTLKANYFYYTRIIRNNQYRLGNLQNSEYPQSENWEEDNVHLYNEVCSELGVSDIKFSEEMPLSVNLTKHRNPILPKQIIELLRMVLSFAFIRLVLRTLGKLYIRIYNRVGNTLKSFRKEHN